MLRAGLTAEALRDCLANVPPVKLLGTELLQNHRPQGGLFPTNVPCEQIRAAVTEIIAYTCRCVTAGQQLSHLAPIPLKTIVVEFGL